MGNFVPVSEPMAECSWLSQNGGELMRVLTEQ